MRIGWLLLLNLVFLAACKEKKSKDSSDPLEGAWYLSNRSGCVAMEPKMSRRKILIFKRVTSQSYDVEQTHFVFEDKNCGLPLLRQRAIGKISISSNQTKDNQQVMEVYVDRLSFHVMALTDKGLTLANLMDGTLGLQGVPKERLCQKDADWNLGEEIEVTGKKCGVDLDTTQVKQGLQTFYIISKTARMHWTDLSTSPPYFPSIPREDEPSTWYRSSI